ncbi:hypothetical protein PR202_gb08858 [Eleusine coracana subsp. coracana]|uniref:Terpene synthase N-terminal domain-containing protein n=1 Tax=Eleusine coracana subsp. coracana TaxID=191504 RepID=A0AAV5EDE3_ELECO|nr:hypothetical protein PR202_gb08858 [Eleusine coracana subsp. coracana]
MMRSSTNDELETIIMGETSEDLQWKDEPMDMPEMIKAIITTLRSIGSGQISISAYDTAWIALVKNLGGDDAPQFPRSIEWIAQNQMSDGSWGDDAFFYAHDRMINTLACVVALTSWDIHTDKCEKGLSFIRENMWRLATEDDDWMLAGFEITFPSLLEMAMALDLDIPYDDLGLQEIYAKRDLKLSKIPKDVMHTIPTSLLHSIEGMQGLDWNKMLKLRYSNGSFMSSPAATAYAVIQTGDMKCVEFLDRVVNKFNGGAPVCYPVEIYERLWAIDRHWNKEEGIGYTRDCPIKDLDDTAMVFRLLRQHGYHISPCVFKNYEKHDEFVCYPGQLNQSLITMHNLYRAADQAAFPGDDDVIRRARSYCQAFLEERRASNQLKGDKWLIADGLPGEVEYALDFPWDASLPRVETRMYLEQYGGKDDVWIGKVLYRMHLINNDMYLKLAKVEFNNFQRLCQLEWHGLKRWCKRNNLEMYGVTPKSVLRSYFLAAANIFEQNRSVERLGWARTAVLAKAFSSIILDNDCTDIVQQGLVNNFTFLDDRANQKRGANNNTGLHYALHELINHLSPKNASDGLCKAWKQWMIACTENKSNESFQGNTALLLVRTIEVCSGRHALIKEYLNLPECSYLGRLVFSICCKLATGGLAEDWENINKMEHIHQLVDSEMKELTHFVLQMCNDTEDKMTRHTFLHVAKSYFYMAHCSPEIIDDHISKVIFESII